MTSMFSLDGQVALVTGARSGIGQAIAIGLAEAGADLVLLGRTPAVEQTAAQVRAIGRRAQAMVLDLSRTDAITEATNELLTRQRIDICVNNAGVIERGPALDVSDEAWRAVLAVNLDAAFLIAQQCGRAMIERGAGKIIMIASLLSFQGGLNVAAYAASKHGIAGLTRALANEWARHGVQVNAIAPGYIATDNTQALRADPDRAAEIRRRIPANRWGQPADLVGAALFLASPASDYVNGHVLTVDGGHLVSSL